MRRAILALLVVLHAGAARAETRYMVGVDTSWELRGASPRVQVFGADVASDKLEHFLAGAAVAWVLRLAGYDPPTALAGSATAGALKEVRDMGMLPGLGVGDVDFGDFAWTLLGGAAYLGVQSLFGPPATSQVITPSQP